LDSIAAQEVPWGNLKDSFAFFDTFAPQDAICCRLFCPAIDDASIRLTTNTKFYLLPDALFGSSNFFNFSLSFSALFSPFCPFFSSSFGKN
jgi:hypothetical protein